MDKMTLPEFISTYDTDDGSIDEGWAKHWEKVLPEFLSKENTRKHSGDCVKIPSPCFLCMLEAWLREYREYFFDKKELDSSALLQENEKLKETLEEMTVRYEGYARFDNSIDEYTIEQTLKRAKNILKNKT